MGLLVISGTINSQGGSSKDLGSDLFEGVYGHQLGKVAEMKRRN